MLVTDRTTPADAPQLRPNPTWKEIVEPVKPFLDKVAEELSAQVQAFTPEISAYARYALTNQGKQIRPALVALSGAAISKVDESLLKVAVIIEMVHLATLVHDDVMDQADVRRCRPTMAANWGNEISVLLGDCLFAHAVTLASSFPTPEVCRAVARATNTVCSGEILQTHQRRNFQMKRSDYFKAVEMKTGELFALSCELGGALAGANSVERNALRGYGLALGTAYQIYDDCLDLFGTENKAGKSLGTDLASGKITLPLLIALEGANQTERELLETAVESLEPDAIAKIFELLKKYSALSVARRVVYQYIKHAQGALGELQQSKGGDALAALGEYLAQQIRALGV
jgi:octaprenyl-diphosphate synthase